MQNIVINFVPEVQQAGQLDDYFDRGDYVEFCLTDLGNINYNIALMIHATSEYFEMIQHGVTAQDTVDFDMKHLDDDDPGMLPNAPYHTEHCHSDVLERAYIAMSGEDWTAYDEECGRILDTYKSIGSPGEEDDSVILSEMTCD